MNRHTEGRMRGSFFWTLFTSAVVAFSAAPSSAQVHDSTLKGSGTNTSPLGVNIPLALYYNNCIIVCNIDALGVTTTLANTNAVYGSATSGSGLYGTASANGNGVTGTSLSGNGVFGSTATTTSNSAGVWGQSNTAWGYGVAGINSSYGVGVYGSSLGAGTGVFGQSSGLTGDGVTGVSNGGGVGVFGLDGGSTPMGVGVLANTSVGSGVYAYAYNGEAVAIDTGPNGIGLHVGATGPTESVLNGNVTVNGTLMKSGGSFKIDHPLDPANKYLSHSFVESPDMKNVYDGTVHTDAAGNATVTLPDWFEALNRDFRYQLTTIGQPAQAWIASEIVNNRLTIKTDKPNVKVSWQVTGIRQDAWANAHRIPVEEDKAEKERGFYLHPELHGQTAQKGVMWARFPEIMKAGKERVERMQAISRPSPGQ